MTYADIIPTILAAVPSLAVAVWSLCKTTKLHNKDQIKQEKRACAEDIKRKLETFYYPYLLIAKENTSLYTVFSQEHLAKDSNYRTLISLLLEKDFSKNDSAILERIVENDGLLKDLINTHANVVDDREIRDLLIKSATHYAFIELAFKKRIIGEVERFEPYVHPNEVYGLVERKARELEKEMQDALKY